MKTNNKILMGVKIILVSISLAIAPSFSVAAGVIVGKMSQRPSAVITVFKIKSNQNNVDLEIAGKIVKYKNNELSYKYQYKSDSKGSIIVAAHKSGYASYHKSFPFPLDKTISLNINLIPE